ncbi:MAG TPA: phage tail tube protein [Gemmatimonadaceae bacterium]|nr:phage tail tube protein [Gemmatimonadaceae bacterium]
MPATPGNALTLAVGKQSAKGTPQLTPTYKLRYTGGFGPDPAQTRITLAETDATRQQGDPIIVGHSVTGSSEHYVRPDEFGLLAYLSLGTIATVGAAADKTHTISATTSGAVPYATLFKAQNVTAYVDRYVDCQLNSVTVSGGAEQPLSMSMEWLGLAYTTGSTDPVLTAITQSPMVYPEVTVTKAGVTTGVVQSFSLTWTNNRSLITGDTGTSAAEVAPGMFAVTGSLAILFETDAERRLFYTGSTGGTAPATVVAAESLNILAQRTTTLSIAFDLNNVIPTGVTVPANTDGSPIIMGYEFQSQRQTALADVLEIAVKNQVVSY